MLTRLFLLSAKSSCCKQQSLPVGIVNIVYQTFTWYVHANMLGTVQSPSPHGSTCQQKQCIGARVFNTAGSVFTSMLPVIAKSATQSQAMVVPVLVTCTHTQPCSSHTGMRNVCVALLLL